MRHFTSWDPLNVSRPQLSWSFPEERGVEISSLLGYPELQKPSPGSVSVITPASNEAGQQALRHAGDQLKENMRLPAFFLSLTSSFFCLNQLLFSFFLFHSSAFLYFILNLIKGDFISINSLFLTHLAPSRAVWLRTPHSVLSNLFFIPLKLFFHNHINTEATFSISPYILFPSSLFSLGILCLFSV